MNKNRARIRKFWLVICSTCWTLLFCPVAASAIAANTNISPEIQKLIDDPSTKVIVNDNTYPATTTTTTTPPAVASTTTPRPAITIDSPATGSVVVQTSMFIAGTAPPNASINIDIQDEDFTRSNIRHETLEHTLGTTTSDGEGNWIFAPQIKVELGKYAISAYIADAKYGKIEAGPVIVSVANVLGKTENVIFWRSYQFWFFVAVLLLIIGGLIWMIVRITREGKKRISPQLTSLGTTSFGKHERNNDTAGSFVTSKSAIKQLERNKKENMERRQELEKEVAMVKEMLMKTADDVAAAGQATEIIERELRQDNTPVKPNDEDNSLIEKTKRHKK